MPKVSKFWTKGLILALLCLVTSVGFWPVRRCGFVNFDDPEYVTEQPYVLAGLTYQGIIWAFTSEQGSNWHPLTSISHMLDVQLFGTKALGHHLVNLLYHTANSILVFLLLRRLTLAFWRSGFVAALFAVHPLHVESVAWISERKDVLSTFFFLLTLIAYAKYVEAKSEVPNPKSEKNSKRTGLKRSVPFFVLALLLFACGLMSKAMVVTLPFVLLLLDYWPLGRIKAFTCIKVCMLEKVPFFLLSAAASLVTFEVQKAQGATRPSEVLLSGRIANALVSYVRYLGKTFWPVDLTVFYPHPLRWPILAVASACLILVGVTAFAVRARSKPYVAVGWYWFLGALVPVIGLVQVGDQAMADRYMYIPSLGLFLALVWSVADFVQRNASMRIAAITIGLIVIGALSIVTQHLTRNWRNSETLFQHALAVDPNNAAAHNFLGSAFSNQGRLKEAEEHFVEALRIRPDFPYAQINYGVALARDGKFEEGASQLLDLLKKRPNDEEAHYSLGLILQQKGDFAGAIKHYQEALRVKPDDAEALNNLAWIRAANANVTFRDGEEAVGLAHRACELTLHRKPVMVGTLAAAYAEAGRFQEAIAAAEKAQAVARESGQAEIAERNGELLKLYQSGRAYHETQ